MTEKTPKLIIAVNVDARPATITWQEPGPGGTIEREEELRPGDQFVLHAVSTFKLRAPQEVRVEVK